ncbi:MlaD family protein [Pokkaliibacter sp. MBI-7]|uniref:PqiB family protein n=1 Tax=Pokkaliibacter sp. MBI-7 TaxID=3040600 RepID=UPI002447007A|nr:MlaD family protein [Pokkaliibacter sp. MBI-7]MDH2436037.1 MlaD family protein [Pokkaliibacter sp. MBI-7]
MSDTSGNDRDKSVTLSDDSDQRIKAASPEQAEVQKEATGDASLAAEEKVVSEEIKADEDVVVDEPLGSARQASSDDRLDCAELLPTPRGAAPVVRKRRSWSLVWLLPLVALLMGGWLLWKTLSDVGITVHITFKSGQGIEAGKTEIRYKGLKVGLVKKVDIGKDLETVIVEAEVDRAAESGLRTGTEFWLVTPSVSFEGVSGLETLVSGNYIGVQPGGGSETTEFVAADKAPPVSMDEPGLHITLRADSLGSVSPGTPVYYKQIKVGTVQEYRLANNSQNVEVDIYVQPPFDELINSETRFWNASGVDISGGLNGFKVRTESLVSLISGGIAFSTPNDNKGEPVRNGHIFSLYSDYASAEAGIKVNIEFGSAQGLVEGVTQVVYRGVPIGTLQKMELSPDFNRVDAHILFDPKAESFLRKGSRFWLVKPSISLSGFSDLDTLVKGNYIAVEPGGGEPSTDFTALGQAPAYNEAEPGLKLTLHGHQLGSVAPGTPLYYHRVEVGSVMQYSLDKDGQGITMEVNVRPQYARLVNTATRFWHASGINIKGGLGGISIQTESLLAIATGGIALGNVDDEKGAPVKPGTEFILYDSLDKAMERGRVVTVRWQQADGLSVGSKVRWNGLEIGEVRGLQPDRNFSSITASIFLDLQGQRLAREGTEFWVVHPQLKLTEVSGLDSIVGGAYVQVRSKGMNGQLKTQFTGLDQAPVEQQLSGFPVILETRDLGSIRPGVTVFYRGVAVGKVVDTQLADTADKVLIQLAITPRYRSLVRTGSRFWNNSGFGMDFGLLSGASIRTQSVETLLAGGISFATPEGEKMGQPAAANSRFELNAEPQPEWQQWAPRIALPPQSRGSEQ